MKVTESLNQPERYRRSLPQTLHMHVETLRGKRQVLSGPDRDYLVYRAKSYDLTVLIKS